MEKNPLIKPFWKLFLGFLIKTLPLAENLHIVIKIPLLIWRPWEAQKNFQGNLKFKNDDIWNAKYFIKNFTGLTGNRIASYKKSEFEKPIFNDGSHLGEYLSRQIGNRGNG